MLLYTLLCIRKVAAVSNGPSIPRSFWTFFIDLLTWIQTTFSATLILWSWQKTSVSFLREGMPLCILVIKIDIEQKVGRICWGISWTAFTSSVSLELVLAHLFWYTYMQADYVNKRIIYIYIYILLTMQGTSYITVRKTGYIRKNSCTYVSYIGQQSTYVRK